MLLIICVDRDDDIGSKAGIESPVIGRERVEEAVLRFGTTDPEDSDLNALFEGMRIYDNTEEEAELVVLTGKAGSYTDSDRKIARQLDEVLGEIDADSAVIVTDGAEDESVIPIVESRMRIDGVRRTVVKQAENLENAYYVLKQLLRDPETRGTILVPIGILLMIYPLDLIARWLNYPGAAIGATLALLGLYVLSKGLGLDDTLEEVYTEAKEGLYGVEQTVVKNLKKARKGIYSGRVSLITYIIALGLLVIGVGSGLESVNEYQSSGGDVIIGIVPLTMAFIQGSVVWLTSSGVVSSIGRILEEYIESEEFPWGLLNAPFYIISIGLVLFGLSNFFIEDSIGVTYLATVFVIAILIGAISTAVLTAMGSSEEESEEETGKEVEEVPSQKEKTEREKGGSGAEVPQKSTTSSETAEKEPQRGRKETKAEPHGDDMA